MMICLSCRRDPAGYQAKEDFGQNLGQIWGKPLFVAPSTPTTARARYLFGLWVGQDRSQSPLYFVSQEKETHSQVGHNHDGEDDDDVDHGETGEVDLRCGAREM